MRRAANDWASLTAKFIEVVVTALVVGTAVSLALLMAPRQAALVARVGFFEAAAVTEFNLDDEQRKRLVGRDWE
jgi:hypothetical protein